MIKTEHDASFFCWNLKEAFTAAQNKRAYNISSLGKVDGCDIYFCAPEKIDPDKKNLLVCGGFHGDEPAGCWSIIRFLETATAEELNGANIFFLPLVNPTGLMAGTRENNLGEDPNQGFCGNDGKKPSREGKILINHLGKLVQAARDGAISMHEDIEFQQTYVWTYEPTQKPGAFTRGLLAALAQYFPIFKGGMEHRGAVIEFTEGIGFNVADNSFENLLVENGVTHVATSETPAHESVPLARRIAAGRDTIAAFIKLRK